jgi:hypothetical protein
MIAPSIFGESMDSDKQNVHHVKSWPYLFEAVIQGVKRHELRKNDRDYRVGDILVLREYSPDSGEYTGRQYAVEVTYITSTERPCAISGSALSDGYCILSIKPFDDI